MDCPLCGENGFEIFKGIILAKYSVQYFQCHHCGLVFTEKPYWLEESYKDSISCIDTGIMSRNVRNALCANVLIDRKFDRGGAFLDYGGGFGVFTRMMRDIGYEWMWMDKYAPNLLARGFEYQNKEKCELVTAFELFEHFAEPGKEIEALFRLSDSILFSTILYDKEFSYKEFSKWWYYVPEAGQHIAFYSERTCKYIAADYGVNYYHLYDDIHLFTKKRLSDRFIKLFFDNRYRWFIQIYFYHKNLKYGKSAVDMEKMIKDMKM